MEYLIYINREKTDVLVNNHEFAFLTKVKKSIDFFNVKIKVNILYKRKILWFDKQII